MSLCPREAWLWLSLTAKAVPAAARHDGRSRMGTGPGNLPLRPAQALVRPLPWSKPGPGPPLPTPSMVRPDPGLPCCPYMAPDPARWPFTVFTAAAPACRSAGNSRITLAGREQGAVTLGVHLQRCLPHPGPSGRSGQRCRLRDGFGLADCSDELSHSETAACRKCTRGYSDFHSVFEQVVKRLCSSVEITPY